MNEPTYTTFQIADFCGVRPTTIIKWIKLDKLKAYVTLGGHRRVRQTELLRFLQEHEFPIPDELRAPARRVLIVEDEEDVGQLLEKTLRQDLGSLEVEWVKDGIEALLSIGKRPPDLVVLDVVMPVVDGARVLSTLHSDPKTRDIKVVGISGKPLALEKLKFMQKHADAFFRKPFDLRSFSARISALLDLQPDSTTAGTTRRKR